jgi:type II secretory pathway pseudopilin PulG
MVVVVSIIALVLAVLSPSMSSGLDSVRMASAADNVATFLNAAVNRAERRQQAVEIIISLKENKLIMISTEPGLARELKIPDGIQLEAVFPRLSEGDPNEVRRLLLQPGAAPPGIGIQLINGHKNRRLIRLDPMTGFPRIETPKEEL